MVREIIHVQVGQCGNQIGTSFWDTMRKEHHLGEDGIFIADNTNDDKLRLDKINVYFKQTGSKRYVPRATLVDLEPGTMDVIKSSNIGSLFSPDNFVFGSSGAGNNWAKGHYTEGAELVDEIIDIIRRETESCDCPQGFQLTQSLGGGTGSGLGTLLSLKIRDNYPDRISCTFSVYPSPKVSDVVVEPYNAVLSIHQLLENTDETFVIDNEALFNISQNILNQNEPKYKDLNEVISMVMSGVTASLRFSGKLNGDLRKMGVNLIPFPRLHFFTVAEAPLFSKNEINKVKLNIQEISNQLWSSRNSLSNIKSNDGKYLTAFCAYRGNIQTHEVDDEINKIHNKLNDDFIQWIPNNIKSCIINIPPEYISQSGTFVANTTAIKTVFERICIQFKKMFKRKAFLHWYKQEGMDEMEFEEADKNVKDLMSEYQDKQDVNITIEDIESDSDDDEDEDDEEAEDNDDDQSDF